MLPRFHLLQLQAFKLQTAKSVKAVLVCTVILLSLGGCAITQPYGNFIQNPSPAFSQYSEVMAANVADQIGRLYPAASTQFDLRHNANDPFGQALIDKLRSDGFAVQETIKPDNPLLAIVLPDQVDETDVQPQQIVQAETRPVLALRYIIDQSDDLYHVSILIEDQRLTRAFVDQSGQIQPAGLWVRRQLED